MKVTVTINDVPSSTLDELAAVLDSVHSIVKYTGGQGLAPQTCG